MILRIRNISFRYGSRDVLKSVELEARGGEVLSVIGPNGAGKSTLLRCASRILKPKTGTVYIDGDELSLLSERQRARKLGYVPQAANEVFPSTVFETVLMGRRPHLNWSVGREDLAVVGAVLERLGLTEFAERYLSEVSGGERQKVLLARALAQEPEVLLLDEPTSNLDVRHQLEVLGLVKDVAHGMGKCVLMVMHDLNVAVRFADKMLMMRDGQVFAAGNPAAILTPENIKAVYGVEAVLISTIVGPQIIALEPSRSATGSPLQEHMPVTVAGPQQKGQLLNWMRQ